MIRDIGLLIAAMGVAFVAFWVFEATKAKRRARGSVLPNLVRILVLVGIAFSLRFSFGTQFLRNAGGPLVTSPGPAGAGAVACAAGIAIAIWARVTSIRRMRDGRRCWCRSSFELAWILEGK